MDKLTCHVCEKTMDENTYWVSYLCKDCALRIQSYDFLVGICPIHNTPQILIKLATKEKKKIIQYTFMNTCSLAVSKLESEEE